MPFNVTTYLETGVVVETGPLILPDPWQRGWKDVISTPTGCVTKIVATFDRPGPYMWVHAAARPTVAQRAEGGAVLPATALPLSTTRDPAHEPPPPPPDAPAP